MRMASSHYPSRHLLRLVLGLTIATLLLSPMAYFLGAQELRIDPRAIVTLLPKDAIPAIRDPAPFLVPAAAVRAVQDSDQVLGVAIGEESRAYPIAFLSWHEIVNDVVGGIPVIAAW
jgi:Protein of unknown function (DUF3179)